MTRRDLQRSIVIHLNLEILRELRVHSTYILTYGLSTNNKKRRFLEAHSFMSTDKEIGVPMFCLIPIDVSVSYINIPY